MWQALKRTADRLLDTVNRSLRRPSRLPALKRDLSPPAAPCGPLRWIRSHFGRYETERHAAGCGYSGQRLLTTTSMPPVDFCTSTFVVRPERRY